jgi:hypothetical protein
MDMFFADPNDPPLPPEEVRLRELRAEPWAEGRRVKVMLELTPFQKRPSAEVLLTDPNGVEAARTSILETFSRKMAFNLHLRPDAPAGEYTLAITVYYQKLPDPEQPDAALPEPLIVERGQFTFQFPG